MLYIWPHLIEIVLWHFCNSATSYLKVKTYIYAVTAVERKQNWHSGTKHGKLCFFLLPSWFRSGLFFHHPPAPLLSLCGGEIFLIPKFVWQQLLQNFESKDHVPTLNKNQRENILLKFLRVKNPKYFSLEPFRKPVDQKIMCKCWMKIDGKIFFRNSLSQKRNY